MATDTAKKTSTNKEVKTKLIELYDELFRHNGYGEIKVEIRILRRGQKEVILHCGKQYRFVVDFYYIQERGNTRTSGTETQKRQNIEVPEHEGIR